MTGTQAKMMVIGLSMLTLLSAGCLGPDSAPQDPSDSTPEKYLELKGCYLHATDPEIHMYGCAEEVLAVQLAPGEEHSVEVDIENLTGFTLLAYADPLATGVFRIETGAFEGSLEVRGGKWFATTDLIDPQEIRDGVQVMIDVCDASSVTVSFQGEVEVPSNLAVRVYSHADHRQFMEKDGEPIPPTCNDTWSHSEWPVG